MSRNLFPRSIRTTRPARRPSIWPPGATRCFPVLSAAARLVCDHDPISLSFDDGTEVRARRGAGVRGVARVHGLERDSGSGKWNGVRWVFLFVGADPNTGWLGDCGVGVDDKGFIRTGADVAPAQCPPCSRGPGGVPVRLALQTSVPGVFAIGDVRAGSTKRVAAAVGEGAAVVAQIHAFLGRHAD